MATNQFEINEEVTPTVNVISSLGNIIETFGIPGTITQQQLTFVDEENNVTYNNHLVQFIPGFTVVIDDLGNTTLEDSFWFSDEELGGYSYQSTQDPLVDVADVLNKINTGMSNTDQAISTISQILPTMNSLNPLYDVVNSNLDRSNIHKETLSAFDLGTEDQMYGTGKAAGKAGESLGLDCQIFQEISENAKGLHDVLEEANSAFKAATDQGTEQEEKARQDDDDVWLTYYNNYLLGGSAGRNDLIPGGVPGEVDAYKDIIPIKEPVDLSDVQEATLMADLVGDLSLLVGNQ